MERQKKLFLTKLEEIQELNTNVTEQKLLEDNNDAEELEIRNTPNIDEM